MSKLSPRTRALVELMAQGLAKVCDVRPYAMSEGYCDRHRWIHQEGHAAVLPCRNWKAEENMSHQDAEKNKRLHETIELLEAMSVCKCGHKESRHFPYVDGDKRSGACMDCNCCNFRPGIALGKPRAERQAKGEQR